MMRWGGGWRVGFENGITLPWSSAKTPKSLWVSPLTWQLSGFFLYTTGATRSTPAALALWRCSSKFSLAMEQRGNITATSVPGKTAHVSRLAFAIDSQSGHRPGRETTSLFSALPTMP